MEFEPSKDGLGKDLPIGAGHYRAYVGSAEIYDLMAAMQFNLLTFLGLREHHSLLDVGCGSLRAGRLFIPYLLPRRYFGIEPEGWLIEEGIQNGLGEDLVGIKNPTFSNDDNFTLTTFNRKFDFILAQSVFTHASQDQIRRCLSQAQEALKLTGLFAANFVEGHENYTGREWVYPDVITYTLEHMQGLVQEQGLHPVPIDWPRVSDVALKWVVIVHPGNEDGIARPAGAAKVSFLERELALCRKRLSDIENHPYVKLGLKVNRFLRAVKNKVS